VLLWLAVAGVAGVAALLAAHPLAFKAVQYLSAACLCWFGLRLVFAKPGNRLHPSTFSRMTARVRHL
jgi:threonine/homoserine/homoserine lactone efflux protein